MSPQHISQVFLTILLGLVVGALGAPAQEKASSSEIINFFSTHCYECHGNKRQKGDLNLRELTLPAASEGNLETWRVIADQIRFHDMPPEEEAQPDESERKQALKWIRSQLLDTQLPGKIDEAKMLLPEFGNLIDHEALFKEPAGPVIPSAPRLWRIRPEIYKELADDLAEGTRGLAQPLAMRSKPGLRDYAVLYSIDEPTTDLLFRNAELVVAEQAKHERYGAIFDVLQADTIPSEEKVAAAIRQEFLLALRREPKAEEMVRFLNLWQKTQSISGHPSGARATLIAVLMQPELLFRRELGSSDVDKLGRKRLRPHEIARAVNYALREKFDDTLWQSAEQDQLSTRAEVVAQVRRMLDEPLADNPRLLEFFAEFFDYRQAVEVFKDLPESGYHDARIFVRDLDYLITHILQADKDVLRELLTTNKAFVNMRIDNKSGKREPAVNVIEFEMVYSMPRKWRWTDRQPVELPASERAGVLTHPAWLVAHSGNFDNDPVKRGKWIRTRLLGGHVPDVPIGVEAVIPDAEHLTLRERLHSATSKAECWRCHRQMDPLGLPFEQFTHYGFHRDSYKGKPVDTRGRIDRTGDALLDDQRVEDPLELVHKLAASKRVEQVFVRHAFRFFHGRNETLGDAATLQKAWRAYRDSDGSFKALVLSLLTSDSFLYRMP